MIQRSTQRGFMLIAGIFLLVIGAVFASVIGFRAVSSSESSGDTLAHTQALYIAQTGIERWIRQRALSNAFVGEGPTAFGNGTFTTASSANDCSGAALPATRRSVTSTGNVSATAAAATICAVVDLLRVGGAMIVYAKDTPAASSGIPFYRRWNSVTNSWDAEAQATTISVGNDIIFMVLKFARTRNEAILGTMNSLGQIHVQVWNGTAWGATLQLVDLPAAEATYRSFDIEYETLGDRAVVVYHDGSTEPNYRIWDGTAWSGATNVTLGGAGSGLPRWINLTPNPVMPSNEIVMIALKDNEQIYGRRWPGGGAAGTAWDTMGAAGAWSTLDDSAYRSIDVEYEQTSGRALFVWGNGDTDEQEWRTWNGSTATLSGISTLTINALGGEARWIKLAPNPSPNSNEIMYGVQDSGNDLNTCLWTGAAWDCATTAHPEHDGGVEDGGDRNFDLVFETHPNNRGMAWLMWGSTNGGDVTRTRRWGGAAWGGITNIGQEAAFATLTAQPSSGAIFGGVYEDSSSPSDNIEEYHLTSGAAVWVLTAPPIWNGGASGNPVRQRVNIAAERYTPIVSWREVLP